jgi:DNA modification methylase
VLVEAVREAGGVTVTILNGDAREVLKTLPSESVQMCVTSPPYFNLRDYQTGTWSGGDAACDHRMSPNGQARDHGRDRSVSGGTFHDSPVPKQIAQQFRATCGKCGATRTDNQIGLEQTPELYVAELVAVFREVRRVLRPDATLWLNLGDSFIDKQLQMIPARVALALQADGWILRSDIIWHKAAPMPESVRDRPTSAHEHVFLLAKSARYFWDSDAVREDATCEKLPGRNMTDTRETYGLGNGGNSGLVALHNRLRDTGKSDTTRNIRNVWTIATQAFPESHFAVFPPTLAERCIRAGTSERGCCAKCGAPWIRVVERGKPDLAHQRASGGDLLGEYHGTSTKDHAAHGVQDASAVKARILAGMVHKETTGWAASCTCDAAVVPCTILDPFAGAFTAPMTADRLQRHAIGIELNADYCDMARRRLVKDAGLFMEITDTPRPAPPCDPDLARQVDLWREPESGA